MKEQEKNAQYVKREEVITKRRLQFQLEKHKQLISFTDWNELI